jgi:hypothetical protein
MELELIRPIFQALSAVDVMPRIKLLIRMITAERYEMANIASDDDLKSGTSIYSEHELDETYEIDGEVSHTVVSVFLWFPLFASPLETDIVKRTLLSYFEHASNYLYDHDNTFGLVNLINKRTDEYTIKYFSASYIPHHLTCFISYKGIKYHDAFIRRVYNHQYNLFRLEQSSIDM